MNKLQEMSDQFKFMYDKFLHGCDAIEAEGSWDTISSGQMEAYYFNDIMCVILHLISADGSFTQKEAEYVNQIFGFTYSPDEMKELYRTEGKDIRSMIKEEVPSGYKRMKLINAGLAEHYKEMLFLACDIVAESDGIVQPPEAEVIRGIKASLNS